MEHFKTYTVKSKKTKAIWVFKYHLQGELHSFVVLEGKFDEKQANWLFPSGRFPYNEAIIKKWKKAFSKFFDVEIGIPEITFDYFYEIYGKKTTKKQSKDFWKKMKEAEKVKAVIGVRHYMNSCKLNNRSPVDPVRYLKHRRYEDED